jgi:hypothetical protein
VGIGYRYAVAYGQGNLSKEAAQGACLHNRRSLDNILAPQPLLVESLVSVPANDQINASWRQAFSQLNIPRSADKRRLGMYAVSKVTQNDEDIAHLAYSRQYVLYHLDRICHNQRFAPVVLE